MKRKDRISCIVNKYINLIIITISLISLYFGVNTTIYNIIPSIIMLTVGSIGLLKTNNPITRYNPLSINKKWKNPWEMELNQNPLQIFKLDKPDKDEVRNRKIEDIIN